MKKTMAECNSLTELFSKGLKSESFSPLVNEELSKKIRKSLEHYYANDDNPGEWLFLEIDFFNLQLLQMPPRFEDFKTLLENEIYKKTEINSENFLLKLLLDKINEPEIIVRLLKENEYRNIFISDDEIAFITAYIKGKDINFIVLLVQHIVSMVEKENFERFFMERLTINLKALQTIPVLTQHIKNELVKKVHDWEDCLKEIKENVTEPLEVLQYWEIQIKSQIIDSIQAFLSDCIVKSTLPINSVPQIINGTHFFQPKSEDGLTVQFDRHLPDEIFKRKSKENCVSLK